MIFLYSDASQHLKILIFFKTQICPCKMYFYKWIGSQENAKVWEWEQELVFVLNTES